MPGRSLPTVAAEYKDMCIFSPMASTRIAPGDLVTLTQVWRQNEMCQDHPVMFAISLR